MRYATYMRFLPEYASTYKYKYYKLQIIMKHRFFFRILISSKSCIKICILDPYWLIITHGLINIYLTNKILDFIIY